MKKRWNKKNKVGIKISENGLIQGVESSSEDTTFKIVSSILSSAVGIMGVSSANKSYDSETDGKILFATLEVSDLLLVQNKEKAKAIIKALKKILEKRDVMQKKQKVFQSKLDILTEKHIILNQQKTDLGLLKYRLLRIELEIKKLEVLSKSTQVQFIKILDNFMGLKSVKKNIIIEHDITQFPKGDMASESIYLKVESSNNGISVNETINANDFSSENGCENCLEIKIKPLKNALGDNYTSISSGDNKGFAYKIPQSYVAAIYNPFSEIGRYPFLVAGKVGRLSSKVNSTNVVFYEKSGFYKEVNASSNPILTSADITAAGKLIESGISEIEGKDETELLKEETDLLELRLKKKKLENELEEIEKD